MTIVKRATSPSKIVTSSSVLTCNTCGHVEMVFNDDGIGKVCPKCTTPMQIVQSQFGVEPESE